MKKNIVSTFEVEKLSVVIAENRNYIGKFSAEYVCRLIKDLLNQKEEIRMVFPAAPYQNEFLYELVKDKSIEWSRIIGFQMDEYIGLPEGSKQLFSHNLFENLFSKVNFKKVHFINSNVRDIQKECSRYELLLKENIIDIVCMGISENGHIAFNDPHIADFNDDKIVKVVELDLVCRKQQVNDGCFYSIDDVPKTAITLTISALLSGTYISVVVHGKSKAKAGYNTLTGKISTECPSSILRTHTNAFLFLDKDSSYIFNRENYAQFA